MPSTIDELDGLRDVPLEPLPRYSNEGTYLTSIASLTPHTEAQIKDFVSFAADAKSWYKHIPARPPGEPMHFYLDPNAGRDRLRRWGHRVAYYDRTEGTRKLHYSWLTTSEYRRRFGYLAFSCPVGTVIWMDETTEAEIWTRDPNFSAPLIEGSSGALALVPAAVLQVGGCNVTQMVHSRTDAKMLWQKWKKEQLRAAEYREMEVDALTGHWIRIGVLCEEVAEERSARRIRSIEVELSSLIEQQRAKERREMMDAIKEMLEYVSSSGK
jgi:hypothetical protein